MREDMHRISNRPDYCNLIQIPLGIASPFEKGKADVSTNLCVFQMWLLSWRG